MAMRKSRTLNLGTGTFVLLGFAALFFLTTQTTSRGLSFASPPHYDLTAKFDNIADLKVGAGVNAVARDLLPHLLRQLRYEAPPRAPYSAMSTDLHAVNSR